MPNRQHNKDVTNEDLSDLIDRPVSISLAQKIIVAVLFLLSTALSIGGTYMVFKSTTEYRITEVEKRLEKQAVIIDQQEQHGFGGHETRITRLETRSDDQQSKISEIKAKLDTLTEILMRVEKKLDVLKP